MSLLENIPESVILKIVDAMINNYDEYGNYYHAPHDKFVVQVLGKDNSISTFIKEYLIQKLGPIQCEMDDVTHWMNEIQIYESILLDISKIAKQKRYERQALRIEKGCNVTFEACSESFQYLDKIIFRKDGGWGVANNNGLVLFKNEYRQKFSQCKYSLFNKGIRRERWIVQNVDNELYGIIDILTSEIILPCLFETIIIEKINQENGNEFDLFKVKKNDLWGYYNYDGKKIVDCIYDTLFVNLQRGFIECGRDGSFLKEDNHYYLSHSRVFYDGIFDLYDLDGILMIGGYNHMENDLDFYKFYFGTFYEGDITTEWTTYGDEVQFVHYKINYEQAICLVLNHQLRPFLHTDNNFIFQKGKIYSSKEEVLQTVPTCLILHHHISLTKQFIYSTYENGEKYIIPEDLIDTFAKDTTTSHLAQMSEEKRQKLLEEFMKQMQAITNEHPPLNNNTLYQPTSPQSLRDVFIEDDIVTIMKLSVNHDIVWKYQVNEIGQTEEGLLLYRIGERCGFYSLAGFGAAMYTAITTNYKNGKIFVAKINTTINDDKLMYNPNYIWDNKYLIEYYELSHNGSLTKLQDNWSIFNPLNYQWFPKNFINNNHIEEPPRDYCDAPEGTEWTDEDSREAMTDGMYGDYPGPGWDLEMFGY